MPNGKCVPCAARLGSQRLDNPGCPAPKRRSPEPFGSTADFRFHSQTLQPGGSLTRECRAVAGRKPQDQYLRCFRLMQRLIDVEAKCLKARRYSNKTGLCSATITGSAGKAPCNIIKHPAQVSRLERLRKIVIHPGCNALIAVFLESIGSYCDNRRARQSRREAPLVYLSRCLQTINLRHMQIHQNCIQWRALCRSKSVRLLQLLSRPLVTTTGVQPSLDKMVRANKAFISLSSATNTRQPKALSLAGFGLFRCLWNSGLLIKLANQKRQKCRGPNWPNQEIMDACPVEAGRTQLDRPSRL